VSDAKEIVDKLWHYCDILREDGLSYGDYVEQLTYLLFLKMAEEQRQYGYGAVIPGDLDWASLVGLRGETLEAHYISILNRLGRGDNMLGVVFGKARNRIHDPAKLERLIKDLVGREHWTSLAADVKGGTYEALLERSAADPVPGAAPSFTPRALISTMVDVMQPGPDLRIADPACGTGGFLLAAYGYVVRHHPQLDPDQLQHLHSGLLTGWEIVDNTARLCAMNLLLHDIESTDSASPIVVDDALRADPGLQFDMVLTNPPLDRRSVVDFVQHIEKMLEVEGRAAVIVPDSVLFEGGAGESVRRRLLHDCDVHTLLRLPTGIFNTPGVKANVLFFDRKPGSDTPWTKDLWIYDLRTNQHFTLKTRTLARSDLDDFVACYRPGARGERVESERFHRFTYDELVARDKASLDLFWLRDESLEDTDNLPPPGVIAAEIVEDLQAALAEFAELADALQNIGVDPGHEIDTATTREDGYPEA
jgi:type I restriction enzyme M protein